MERIETFPNNIRNHIMEIIGEKKEYNRIYKDKSLQEEIERYLGSTLIQLILVSGVYNDSSDTSKKEEFTLDLVDSVFDDDNVIFEDENLRLTMGYLIRSLNTKYNRIANFYAPIKEFRSVALKAEAVYKKEYDRNGIEGLKAVYDSFDIILDDNTVNKRILDQISPSKTVQRDLINIIILNRRGLHQSETPEQIEDNFYTQMASSFDREKRNNRYRRLYV